MLLLPCNNKASIGIRNGEACKIFKAYWNLLLEMSNSVTVVDWMAGISPVSSLLLTVYICIATSALSKLQPSSSAYTVVLVHYMQSLLMQRSEMPYLRSNEVWQGSCTHTYHSYFSSSKCTRASHACGLCSVKVTDCRNNRPLQRGHTCRCLDRYNAEVQRKNNCRPSCTAQMDR